MAEPVLLHLRVPLHSVLDLDRHLRRDHSGALLLPALQRGLQLVVESLLNRGFFCFLPLPLLDLLLLHEAGDHKTGLGNALLRVHDHHLLRLLRLNWHNRFLRLLLVREKDLLFSEDRLETN